MIADMPSKKKLNPVVTALFIRGRELNISLVFITQSYFKESQKPQHRIIKIQMKKKYLEKDIHLEKKDRKLLMI